MNILMAPAIVSLAAVGLLVLAVGGGLALQLNRRTAPAGKSILWYSSTSLWMAIIFAWVTSLPLALVLGPALGGRGFLVGLWVSSLLGLLVGLVWARRHPGGRHLFRGRPISWWIVGGFAFALLGLGLWLTWQSANDAVRPRDRVGFWLWLSRTIGLD
jgi:hypothetical protein